MPGYAPEMPTQEKTDMAKTVGRFDYSILAPKQGDIPVNAIVHIVPKTYSTDESGRPLLSPQLMSEQEIDWHVQAYKEDLDHVGRLAKRALRRANERTRELNAKENDDF